MDQEGGKTLFQHYLVPLDRLGVRFCVLSYLPTPRRYKTNRSNHRGLRVNLRICHHNLPAYLLSWSEEGEDEETDASQAEGDVPKIRTPRIHVGGVSAEDCSATGGRRHAVTEACCDCFEECMA